MKPSAITPFRSRMEKFRRGLLLSIPVLSMAVGAGWVADGLALMLPWLTDSTESVPAQALWMIGLGLPVFLVSAVYTYLVGSRYLPVRVLAQSEQHHPVRALVLAVSNRNFRFPEENDPLCIASRNHPNDPIRLTGDIEQDSRQSAFCWNWQQLLRGILPHRDRLEHLYLIGSKDNGQGGSHGDLTLCREFLARYVSDGCTIDLHESPVNFNNLDEQLGALEQATYRLEKQYDLDDAEIMLDCTGGTKTTSIAVALYTTRNPNMSFQYLDNDGNPKFFNVIAEREGNPA